MENSIKIAEENQSLAKSKIKELQNLDLSSTKPQTFALVGMGVGAVLLSGMFITTIISGVLAIGITTVALVGGWYGLKNIKALEPAIRDKMRNKQLELLIKEAKENSLMHLTNQVLENTRTLEAASQSVQKIKAMVRSLKDELDKADPNRKSYKKKQDVFETVKQAAINTEIAFETAKQKNMAFEQEVEDHRSLAKFNDAAADIVALMDSNSGKGLDDILNLEAFRSISDSFNESIVAIEFSANQALVN